MGYLLSGLRILGIGGVLLSSIFSAGELRAASAISNTVTSYEYAELNNCIIPIGESSCTATLVVYGPTGMTYTVKNLTRAITSSNIITPNNYILYYDTRYAYVLKDTILGDAANRLTYGDNDLTITPPGTNIASLKAVGNASCASGSAWNGKICSLPNPPEQSDGTTTSIVTIKSGNGDTSYSFDLPKNISKNYYMPDQVEKKISIPSTTSVLNITLSSTKDRCSISPNYSTDSGLIFSSNAKDFMKSGLQSATTTIPVFATYSSIASSSISYGKLSSISISCDNYTELVKDLIIFKLSSLSSVPPVTDRTMKASNCSISIGKGTCTSTVSIKSNPSFYYSLENSTRGLTMTNAFYPGSSLTLSSSPLGEEAANSLTNGINSLRLKEGDKIVTSTQATASCVSGSTWNGQLCKENAPITPLAITCSKTTYEAGDSISCKISGGSGVRMCWQTGTSTTSPVECTSVGWVIDGSNLYYSKNLSTGTIGNYTLFVKDALGKSASTTVSYKARYQELITDNCTIPTGKNSCTSTVYLVNPISGKSYDLRNTTRNITTKNFFTPNSIGTLPGSNYPVYKVSTALSNESANIGTYGTNNVIVVDNTISTLSAKFIASCEKGSSWNGQICMATTKPPVSCTLQVRLCEDGIPMPRNPDTCEWLPGQCAPIPTTTDSPLTGYSINDTTYPFTGSIITLKDTVVFSLKGKSRPGSILYFYRTGEKTYETAVADRTSGEWSFAKIWSPTGSKVIIPGENTYKLSTVPPGTQSSTTNTQGNSLIATQEYTLRINLISTSSSNNSVVIEAKNCIIPIGKSTCASTVNVTSKKYIGTTGGRSFDYRNFTRNLTTSNLFTPNNATTVNGGYPVYTVTSNATGDAANYATIGDNDFGLIEGGEVIAKVTMTATCANKSSWNGQFCKENAPTNPILTGGILPNPTNPYAKMTGCTISEGSSTCPSTLMVFALSGKTFTVKNVTRNIESANSITPEDFHIVGGKGVYISKGTINSPETQQLTNGVNFLIIKENGLVPLTLQARAIARCAPGTTWNETKCIKKNIPNFSTITIETAQGVKSFVNSKSISFDPAIDSYLTLRGEGPLGNIQVYEGNPSNIIASSTSLDAQGKWKITLSLGTSQNPGNHTYTIWDGTNTNTATKINVDIKTSSINTPNNSSSNSGNTSSGTSTSISSPLIVEMITLGN
ncbi:MAG: hypothetical protein HHAS10_05420 [Candidatus Altimarinota bacterium]